MSGDEPLSPVEEFFKRATDNGKAQFIFTLLRVGGMLRERQDPLLVAEEILASLGSELRPPQMTPGNAVDALRGVRKLLGIQELYELLFNLARCVKGEAYLVSPFGYLGTGHFPHYRPPAIREVVRALHAKAAEVNEPILVELTALLMADHFGALLDGEDLTTGEVGVVTLPAGALLDLSVLANPISQAVQFCRELLAACRRFRLEFKKLPRFHKWPEFMTLELLVSDDVGLYGFKVHNDSGSASTFARGPDWTDAINLGFTDNQLAFNAGILDDARREWMVGDRRLCEVGLAGRYNERACWKPVIHPGATDAIQRDAVRAAADDRVRGSLFYMYCTGHRGIEFAAKATLQLAGDLRFPSGMELYKCHSDTAEGVWIYDGWLELPDTSPETVVAGLTEIERTMHRLAFAYDVDLRWCVKYRLTWGGTGWAQPSEDDLRHLGALSTVPADPDAQRILDGVIDWYRRGRSAHDAATGYLCYWIALESLALALFDGDLRGHYPEVIPEAERQAAADEARADIRTLYGQLYAKDPIDFVTRAYFEAIPHSLTRKTRTALIAVFGEQSGVIDKVYAKREGYSLADIRHHLAHGRFSLWHREHAELVAGRTGDLAELAKEFIVRVLLRLRPEGRAPEWGLQYLAAFSLDDPRACLVVSDERILPKTDWKIRAAWIR